MSRTLETLDNAHGTEKRIMKIRRCRGVVVGLPPWSFADFAERSKTALVNASLSGGAQKDKSASLADIKKIFGLDEEDSEDEVY